MEIIKILYQSYIYTNFFFAQKDTQCLHAKCFVSLQDQANPIKKKNHIKKKRKLQSI